MFPHFRLVSESLGLWVAETEVTIGQWNRYASRAGGSPISGDNQLPRTDVSWGAAEGFCAHYGFVLPSVEEWMAAAGDKASKSELSDVAWWAESSGGKLQFVAQRKPNKLGLYDMLGNTWEWCNSDKGGTRGLKARMGGGYDTPGHKVDTAAVDMAIGGQGYPSTGFRVVLKYSRKDK